MPLSDAMKVAGKEEEQLKQVYELHREVKALAEELRALSAQVKLDAKNSRIDREDIANRVVNLHITEGRVAQLAADAFTSKVDAKNAAIEADNSVKRLM